MSLGTTQFSLTLTGGSAPVLYDQARTESVTLTGGENKPDLANAIASYRHPRSSVAPSSQTAAPDRDQASSIDERYHQVQARYDRSFSDQQFERMTVDYHSGWRTPSRVTGFVQPSIGLGFWRNSNGNYLGLHGALLAGIHVDILQSEQGRIGFDVNAQIDAAIGTDVSPSDVNKPSFVANGKPFGLGVDVAKAITQGKEVVFRVGADFVHAGVAGEIFYLANAGGEKVKREEQIEAFVGTPQIAEFSISYRYGD